MKEEDAPKTQKRSPTRCQSTPRPNIKRLRSTQDQAEIGNPPTPDSSSFLIDSNCYRYSTSPGSEEETNHEFDTDDCDTTSIRYAQFALEVLPPEIHSLYQKLSRVGSQHVELDCELAAVPLSRGCEYFTGHQDLLLSLDQETQWCHTLSALRTYVNKFYFNNPEPSPIPCCAAESNLLESARAKELRPLGVFFIEDTGSNIRLSEVRGWVLQWYRRACDIISIGNGDDVGPVLPIVQIYNGSDFYLTFAVDKGDHVVSTCKVLSGARHIVSLILTNTPR